MVRACRFRTRQLPVRGDRREANPRCIVMIWLAVTLVSLMVNPLPWQRYYLPLFPIVTLLAVIGLADSVELAHLKLKSRPAKV